MKRFLPLGFALLVSVGLQAQFTFGGQLVQRGEYRSGYGKLISDNADPAAFISQRFRLQASYAIGKVQLFASLQDVRTWGNTSQINATDGLFSVHEAWTEIHFDSSWSVKLGRQELNYDNARFLGNLDWAMQGRSHDFGLVKYEKKNMKLHFGSGYSQDGEALSGNIFTVANQYKTAQLLRFEDQFGAFEFAFLFWNNGKQYTVYDTANVLTAKGIRYSQTIGLPTLRYKIGNTTLSAFAYYQTGKDVKNKNLAAFDANLQVSQLIHANDAKKNQLRLSLGGEVLSGTAGNYTGNTNSSFSPMYGTNHMHNGYMDLFYVGGRQENSVGLEDFYLYTKFEFNPSFFVSLNGHYFMTYADYYSGTEKQDPALGTEADATIGYILNESVSFQGGYSQLFATKTLERIQGVANPKAAQNWAYIMVIVRPKSDKRFIGLSF